MEEQLVSLETAKLLKEKGFDIKCLWWYDLSTNELSCFGNSYRYQQRQLEKEINTPTQALAQKWLREVHKLYILIDWWKECGGITVEWSYNVYDLGNDSIGGKAHNGYSSYEEALEAGLIEVLKTLK